MKSSRNSVINMQSSWVLRVQVVDVVKFVAKRANWSQVCAVIKLGHHGVFVSFDETFKWKLWRTELEKYSYRI